MKTIKIWTTLLGILGLIATVSVQASSITASNSCQGGVGCEPTVSDTYGFLWTVSTTADPLILSSSVQNTAPAGSAPLIDQVFFNLNPTLTLGTQFFVENIDPTTWVFSAASGGVLFDYIGDEGIPGEPDGRVAAQESLTFDLRFITGVLPTPPLDIFLTADQSSGAGAGGGTDIGQVAVSFQALTTGEGSDLLAANWSSSSTGNGSGPGGGVPEPNILALLGISMLGVLVFRQRRKS